MTRWVIIGTRIGRRAQRRFVGIGSKEQDTLDEFVIMVVTSKSVVGLKADSLDLHGRKQGVQRRAGHLCRRGLPSGK